MIVFRQKGNFSKTEKMLQEKSIDIKKIKKYADLGIEALMSNTPKDTGLTASSWYYTIEKDNGIIKITYCNSNIQDGVPIAVILQYGHATNNGGWVEGKDYINPSIQPIFDEIANKMWKEVTKK